MTNKALVLIVIAVMIGSASALFMRVEPLIILVCLFLLLAIFIAGSMIHAAINGETNTEVVNGRLANVEYDVERLKSRIDLLERD